MEKKEIVYKMLAVKEDTHDKVRRLAFAKGMTMDEFINKLLNWCATKL